MELAFLLYLDKLLMNDGERAEWLAQRRTLLIYLQKTQQQIIDYPPNADDEDHRFLIRKAIYYQNMITKIDDLLNNDNN